LRRAPTAPAAGGARRSASPTEVQPSLQRCQAKADFKLTS
jgi:hypothetical protein